MHICINPVPEPDPRSSLQREDRLAAQKWKAKTSNKSHGNASPCTRTKWSQQPQNRSSCDKMLQGLDTPEAPTASYRKNKNQNTKKQNAVNAGMEEAIMREERQCEGFPRRLREPWRRPNSVPVGSRVPRTMSPRGQGLLNARLGSNEVRLPVPVGC